MAAIVQRAGEMTLDVVDEIGSTSDALKERAGQVWEAALLARRQTRGRGRLGRHWQTIEGNLFLSVLWRPGTTRSPGHWSLLAAVALAESVIAVLPGGPAPRLKWPNDVLLADGKVAGILAEVGRDGTDVPWLVLGFGVNLAAAPEGLGRATACVAAHAPAPMPETFARLLLDRLSWWRRRYAAEGFAPVAEAWSAFGPETGVPLTVWAGPDSLTGRFAGLSEAGGLLLDTGAARLEIVSGELA